MSGRQDVVIFIALEKGGHAQRDPEELKALAALDADTRVVVAVEALAHFVAVLLDAGGEGEIKVGSGGTGIARARRAEACEREHAHDSLMPKTMGKHRNMAVEEG